MAKVGVQETIGDNDLFTGREVKRLLDNLIQLVNGGTAPPEGASPRLPADRLGGRSQPGSLSETSSPLSLGLPMTVAQVANSLGKAPSTVRGWLSSGLLQGAFKLNGKEWRIPIGALQAFMSPPNLVPVDTAAEPEEGDIGDWRKVVRRH